MMTSEGLLGPNRKVVLLFPHRCGDIAVCAFSPGSARAFFSTALALAMGLRLCLVPDSMPELILEACVKHEPTVFMGTSGAYSGLLQAGAVEDDLHSVRLWFAPGADMPKKVVDTFRGLGSMRLGALRLPALFVQSFDAGGRATMLALKPSLPFAGLPEGVTGPALPPNRMRVVDDTGHRVMRGEEGEVAIKGPAVTPGYWNDIAGTLAVKRDGWLHTGMRAQRNRFSITLLT
jgi:acyl-CoA synthetase (AMP-forming)/AMP-acid ligase II